jgi:hypothetical protein
VLEGAAGRLDVTLEGEEASPFPVEETLAALRVTALLLDGSHNRQLYGSAEVRGGRECHQDSVKRLTRPPAPRSPPALGGSAGGGQQRGGGGCAEGAGRARAPQQHHPWQSLDRLAGAVQPAAASLGWPGASIHGALPADSERDTRRRPLTGLSSPLLRGWASSPAPPAFPRALPTRLPPRRRWLPPVRSSLSSMPQRCVLRLSSRPPAP